jgi:NAD(P)-dependent dehydrogenase (short-subunit alcohol dehydrogenase family)
MSEALAQETGILGVKVTICQVGHMDTDFGRSLAPTGPLLEAYAPLRQQLAGGRRGSDPDDIAAKVLKLADMEEPPLRVLLGRPLDDIRRAYEERLALWARWDGVL